MTPQIDDAHIDKNEIVDRAMDAICDGFASHDYLNKSSFDERVCNAIYDQLQHAEIAPLR